MRKNDGTNRLLVLFAITAQRISFQTFGYPLPGLPFANGLELVENYNSSWFYLEMFGESDYSNIAVNIYFIVSIFTGEALIRLKGAKRLLVLLFPNFMFGRRNGALAVGDINIKFAYAMAALIITSLLFGILSVLKFQKKDIY